MTHGAEYRGQLVPFGETVMAHWLTRSSQKVWVRGVFVGKHETDDTYLVATEWGVIGRRTIRRLTKEACWDKAVLTGSGGSPWKAAPSAHGRGLARQRPQPHTLPIAVAADREAVEPGHQRAPASSSAAAGGEVAAEAEQPDGNQTGVVVARRDMSADSSSSSSSAPPVRKRVRARSPRRDKASSSGAASDPLADKRKREDGPDSNEEERMRAAALSVSGWTDDSDVVRVRSLDEVVSALSSPHGDEPEFLHPIDDDERAVAHHREIEMLRSFGVFSEVDERSLPKQPKIITTTWVDRRKNSEVRSRLCAREYNTRDGRLDTFASTPSAASLRIIDILATSFGVFAP